MAGLLGNWGLGKSNDEERDKEGASTSSGDQIRTSRLSTTYANRGSGVYSEFDEAFGERGGTIQFASRSESPTKLSLAKRALGSGSTNITHTTHTTRYITPSHEIHALSESPSGSAPQSPTRVAYMTEQGWQAGGNESAVSRFTLNDSAESSSLQVNQMTLNALESQLGAQTSESRSISRRTVDESSGSQPAVYNTVRTSGELIGSSMLSTSSVVDEGQSQLSSLQPESAHSHAGRLSGAYSRRESGGYSRRESGGYTRRGSGFGSAGFVGDGAVVAQHGTASSHGRPISGGYSMRSSGAWTGDGSSKYDDAEDVAEDTVVYQSRSSSRTGSFYTLSDTDGPAEYEPYTIAAADQTSSTPPTTERAVHTSSVRTNDGTDDDTLLTPRRNLFTSVTTSDFTRGDDKQQVSRAQSSDNISGHESRSGFSPTTDKDAVAANNLAGQLESKTGTVRRRSNIIDNTGHVEGSTSSVDGSRATQTEISAPTSSQTVTQLNATNSAGLLSRAALDHYQSKDLGAQTTYSDRDGFSRSTETHSGSAVRTEPSLQTQASAQNYNTQPRQTQGSVVVAQPTTTGGLAGREETKASAQDYEVHPRQTQGTVVIAQPTTSGKISGATSQPQPAITAQSSSGAKQGSLDRSAVDTEANLDVRPRAQENLLEAESKPVETPRSTTLSQSDKRVGLGQTVGSAAIVGGVIAGSDAIGSKDPVKSSNDDVISRSATQKRISRDIVSAELKPATITPESASKQPHDQTSNVNHLDSTKTIKGDGVSAQPDIDKKTLGVAIGSALAGGAIGTAVIDHANTRQDASTADAASAEILNNSGRASGAQKSAAIPGSSVQAGPSNFGNIAQSSAQNRTQSAASAGNTGYGIGAAAAPDSRISGKGKSPVLPAQVPTRKPSTSGVSWESFRDAKNAQIARTLSQSSRQETSGKGVVTANGAGHVTTENQTPVSIEKQSDALAIGDMQSVEKTSTAKNVSQGPTRQHSEQGQSKRSDSAQLAAGLAAGGALAAATLGSSVSPLPETSTKSEIPPVSDKEASPPPPQPDAEVHRVEETGSGDQYLSDGKELAESGMINFEDGVDEKFIHPFGDFKSAKAPNSIVSDKDEEETLARGKIERSQSAISRFTTATDPEELEEINRLMSRMFGRTRQEQSEEEKTRHVGVVFKHLTVKGMGLGAALQPSTSDIFLGLPRFLRAISSTGSRKAAIKPPIKTIIQDFSGVIRPGEMCLVLGRPGSGCSTFLKVIGNQRFGYESIEGEVTYGGTDAHTMLKRYRGEVLYNPEEDLHYATLSVKRTLEFALKTKTPGKESRNQGETAKEYVTNFLRAIVKLFWIEHTLGTKVGNEYVRGVSGGEKKRVSIAEAMVTKASIQCWDNSTRGLDASTALEYVSSIRSLTDMAHISTAVALYQAGENLYRRFDKVLLIDGGRCAYFGDAATAGQYFKDLGFVQPDRWTTADFLTSVTDEHERHIKEGWEDRIPRTSAEFGDAFMRSAQYEANLKEIDVFNEETKQLIAERAQLQGKAMKRKNYTISFWRQVVACTHRQFLVMLGDKETLIGKWGGILFQSLIVGSLFYNMPKTSLGVFPRGGVLFFALLFNALLALAELTASFQSRPIILKHKSFQFYRPAAFAIAQTVVDFPLVFVQVFLFDIVVYFMSNLSRTAGQFWLNFLLLYMITMTMYAFFRAVGSLSGSLDSATRVTGVFIQAIIVYTGYLIPPTKMHPWFSWIRWINPVQYGFEALMANEFHNLNITCVTPNLVPLTANSSPQYQGCTLQGSQPGSTTVSGAAYIQVAYKYTYAHVWRNFGIIIAFFVFFVTITAVGMELQKPNKGGGSVTIYKRGQVPKSLERAMEVGQEPVDIEKGNASGKDAKTSWAEKEHHGSNGSNGSDSDEAAKGVAKNETVFTWQDVNYTIPYQKGERQLLRDVQGYVRPGKLTALMGASGAGKTTLLNTLAQRITFGRIEGEFLVDGRPLPKSFQRSSGFAEQMDVHEPTATVREALRFSALLRQPREVPTAEKYEYCETILRLLEMEDIAGATIGISGNGLNQEQRKRLTIGVELASKPELLMFLDEPTSGLDSQSAFNIVRLLRKLAAAGQAILCTIHQPSAVLFEEFDELILLKSGGRIVYHGELGPDSRNMIRYFESNGGKKCSPKANPAEYMLEVIGAGDPDYDGPDWGDVWAGSDEKDKRTHEIHHLIQQRRDATTESALKDQREYAMGWWVQIYVVVYRNFVAYWRSPNYIIGKFILHIVTGLFNTFTFWHLGNSSIDMQSRLFSVFMSITIAPPLIQQLQPKFLNLRMIYQSRERNSKIYGWYAFVWAAILTELPYNFVAGTIYWCCWYWATWFPRDTYTSATLWLYICMFELFYTSFGQAIASFAPNENLAAILVPTFFTFVVSFCGVVVPYASLPYFWRSWMYWLTPFTYLVSGMLSPLLHNVKVICSEDELAKFNAPPGQNCSTYADAYANRSGGYVTTLDNGLCGFCQFRYGDDFGATFNVYYSDVWRNYGILYAYVLFNFAVVFFASYLYLGGGRKLMRWIRSGRK